MWKVFACQLILMSRASHQHDTQLDHADVDACVLCLLHMNMHVMPACHTRMHKVQPLDVQSITASHAHIVIYHCGSALSVVFLQLKLRVPYLPGTDSEITCDTLRQELICSHHHGVVGSTCVSQLEHPAIQKQLCAAGLPCSAGYHGKLSNSTRHHL